MSPSEKHPLIASTWTSESLPRTPSAVSVEHSRHELKQRDKSRSSFYAVFNARATSSRRSECVSSRALSLPIESSASPLCPHEEPRTPPRAVDLVLSPRGGAGTFDAPRSPLWTPPADRQRPPWLRRAARAASSPPETSAETLDDLWPVTELRRARTRAAGLIRRPEEHQLAPTRDRATPPEEPLPPRVLRHAPKGTTPHHGAPPGPSRDPSPDPSTPRRSEDHHSASGDLGDPKNASIPREPASEPQDPIAATHHASPPRRTRKRRRQMRRDPADRSAGNRVR